MVPAEILATGNGYAIAVYAAIAQHADRKGHAYPSIARLQQITGWSRPTIDKAIKALCGIGALVKNHRSSNGMKQSNSYDLPLHGRAKRGTTPAQKSPKNQMETTLPTSEATLPTMETSLALDGNDVGIGTQPRFHEQEPVEQEPVEQDVPPISPDEPKLKASAKKKPLTFLPDDWGISDGLIDWAAKSGFTEPQMQSQIERFKNNAVMKQHKYADWDRAFQNWMGNARDWGHLSPNRPGGLTIHQGGRGRANASGDENMTNAELEDFAATGVMPERFRRSA